MRRKDESSAVSAIYTTHSTSHALDIVSKLSIDNIFGLKLFRELRPLRRFSKENNCGDAVKRCIVLPAARLRLELLFTFRVRTPLDFRREAAECVDKGNLSSLHGELHVGNGVDQPELEDEPGFADERLSGFDFVLARCLTLKDELGLGSDLVPDEAETFADKGACRASCWFTVHLLTPCVDIEEEREEHDNSGTVGPLVMIDGAEHDHHATAGKHPS